MKKLWVQGKRDRYSWSHSASRRKRSRRSILLAVCVVALICFWQSGTPSQVHHNPSRSASGFDHRSQRRTTISSSEQGGTRRLLVGNSFKRFEAKNVLLTKVDEIGSRRFLSPKDRNGIHGIQLENEHTQNHHDDSETIPDHGYSELHEEYRGKNKANAVQEEHNPDYNPNVQQEEPLDENAHDPPQEARNGEEVVNASPDTGPKPATEPNKKQVEKEPAPYLSLEEKADSLPEILYIPLEDAVAEMHLAGWEDEWLADAFFEVKKWGFLEEPKIDFVYLWVNGSEEAFRDTKRPYEENSVLNDPEGHWIKSHGINRYRDWDELKYSLRSLEKHASGFRNKIQILVNSVEGTRDKKQVPTWLNDEPLTKDIVHVLAQEEFFDSEKDFSLPTFNSLTIENQIFNIDTGGTRKLTITRQTPSNIDNLFALSDDMLLGRLHAASDIYSPLFGPVMGFKTNTYNTVNPPTVADASRFGEKPFLIYTSWLLNRRFGNRKRAGQGHFGHSISRSVMREAISSFPGPELRSAHKRFRGESGFQLYSWYVAFHYLIERQWEALLWSYIVLRSDIDNNGNLDWNERQTIVSELRAGTKNEGRTTFRKRNFYHVAQLLQRAGLEPPKVNVDVQWTSLDGPATIRGIDCSDFDVNDCLGPGFSSPLSDARTTNRMFSSAVVLDRLARQQPKCGDCLLKLLLNQCPRGLSPLLPPKSMPTHRELVIKTLMRYRYTIIQPDALFVMVTDAEQVDSTLVSRYVRQKKPLAGQLCLNDDVGTDDEGELRDVMNAMTELYQGLFPDKSPYEK